MVYNMSLINGSGIVPIMQTVNDNLTYGWYGNMALITITIILFMGFFKQSGNAQKAMAFSSLFLGLFSIMFRTMGLVPDETVVISWAIAGIIIAISFMFAD